MTKGLGVILQKQGVQIVPAQQNIVDDIKCKDFKYSSDEDIKQLELTYAYSNDFGNIFNPQLKIEHSIMKVKKVIL